MDVGTLGFWVVLGAVHDVAVQADDALGKQATTAAGEGTTAEAEERVDVGNRDLPAEPLVTGPRCSERDCPLPAHAAVELPAVAWVGGELPAVWRAVCDDHLADHRLSVRVVDFAGA